MIAVRDAKSEPATDRGPTVGPVDLAQAARLGNARHVLALCKRGGPEAFDTTSYLDTALRWERASGQIGLRGMVDDVSG